MKFLDDRSKILRAGSNYVELSTTLDPREWARCSHVGVDNRLRLDISVWKPPRTLSQNAMFHGLCREIARATGNDAELVKEAMKEQYGTRMSYGNMRVVTPTHLMDPGEMANLIDATIAEAIQCGADVQEYVKG